MSTMSLTRAYSVKELAGLYGVSSFTMKKWLEPHRESVGEKQGRFYTPLQVKIIFDCLGEPPQG